MADRKHRGEEAVAASSHRLLLALCFGALVIAVILGGLEILLPAFEMGDLPTACAFRRATGTPCPGCGLTRAWVAMGRGAVGESLAFHRLGWVVMLYVALQAIRHALWLWVRNWREVVERAGKWLDRGLILLAVALFANWGFVLGS
ncbi:MAG: DUF2752 domain-containing protein [Acidobacteriota bacterium]